MAATSGDFPDAAVILVIVAGRARWPVALAQPVSGDEIKREVE